MLAPQVQLAGRWARGEAGVVALENPGLDPAKVIIYQLRHYEVDIVRLVQPFVDQANVGIVGMEEMDPRPCTWVHPQSLKVNKVEGRIGSTGCNTLRNQDNLVVSMCFSG